MLLIPRGRFWVSCEFFGKRDEIGAVSWEMESVSCGIKSISYGKGLFSSRTETFSNPIQSDGQEEAMPFCVAKVSRNRAKSRR
jgi:hypothetical protein